VIKLWIFEWEAFVCGCVTGRDSSNNIDARVLGVCVTGSIGSSFKIFTFVCWRVISLATCIWRKSAVCFCFSPSIPSETMAKKVIKGWRKADSPHLAVTEWVQVPRLHTVRLFLCFHLQ